MLADLSLATQRIAGRRQKGQVNKIQSEQTLPDQSQKNPQNLTNK